MSDIVKKQIQALVDLETEGWNTKNPDFFLDMIHPDMVWPWPPTSRDHDPARWEFVLGRFDRKRAHALQLSQLSWKQGRLSVEASRRRDKTAWKWLREVSFFGAKNR